MQALKVLGQLEGKVLKRVTLNISSIWWLEALVLETEFGDLAPRVVQKFTLIIPDGKTEAQTEG